MKLILTLILLIKWLSITIEAQKICHYPIAVLNQTVPQIIDLEKIGFGTGFTENFNNKKITIVGIPTNETDQFAINLAESGELFKTANVPFHFNPRFDYDYDEYAVVRNSWLKPRGWETEERSGDFPFEIGQPFVLEFIPLYIRYTGITTYVNDKMLGKAYLRPYLDFFSKISQLEITGAIKLISITLCGEEPKLPECVPITFSNVSVPVNYDFEKIRFGLGFLPDKKITINGTPISDENGGPKDFVINLGENGVMGKNASILFSFNPRFKEKVVVLNSWTKEKGWGIEQRPVGFRFVVGQPFVVDIYAHNGQIYVSVDKNYLARFYQNDLSKVSQIEISRDVKVSSVVFCKTFK